MTRDAQIEAILSKQPKQLTNDLFRRVSTEDLFAVLHELSNRPKSFHAAAAIIKYLIQERGAEPSPQLYECLIACARDPQASAEMIAQLLAEIRELKLPTGSMLFHDALEALAIHPNYLLRNEILWAMKKSWTTIDPRGEAMIALGLLRDGQYELALDKAEEVLHSPTEPPPPWLSDIFVLVFARQGFLDEAVRLAHAKLATTGGVSLPQPLWIFLLDECARASHHVGAKYIWSRLLPGDRGRIPDGTLLHLLNTAARAADPELAADATAALSSRGARLGPHHYEAVIDSYAAAGDVPSALRALCIMNRALSAVPEASTRSILSALLARPSLLDRALDALPPLVADHHDPPIQAVNVLIEAAIATARPPSSAFRAALDIYTSMPRYTHQPADTVTLRHLLRACDDAAALRTLVAAHPAAALRADPAMFERAVYEFALAERLDDAYAALRRLAASERWVSRDTALAIVRRSLDARDERVWNFLEECKARGMDVEGSLSVEARTRRDVTRGRRVVEPGDEEVP